MTTPAGAGRPWLGFAVAGTAIFLTIVDLFIVNVAIDSIGPDFVATASDLS